MAKQKRLGDLLVSLRIISEQQLNLALEAQKHNPMPLGAVLVTLGYISEELLLSALAAHIGVYPWRLVDSPPDPKALAKLSGDVCRAHRVLPVALRGDLLMLAMINPHDIDAIDFVRNTTGLRIEPVLADAQRLVKAIDGLYGGRLVTQDLDKLVDAAVQDVRTDHKDKGASSLTEEDTRPVVGLVNQILVGAIRARASDIHIEPRQNRIEIRYRVDGQLQLAQTVPNTLLPMLTARLKIMAELDIVEYRLPQDGRISANLDGRTVDIRVSVLPNHYGQRIVLRILDKANSLKEIDDVGFTASDLKLFRSLVHKPYGMFLVTGPTGSGKTTTLYAALQELRSAARNVMTCEDPIEYDVDGVNQSQVNEKVGLTFAKQLRAILRQDPDVILVGEIRDGETAETAIRAALTGHLVLSTLHCNDSPSAVPRLFDMGVEPFVLSTSLIGVMSQRLLRQLCPHCRDSYVPNVEERRLFEIHGLQDPELLCRPVGCAQCSGTGYQGRKAVHELLPITPSIANMIATRAPISELRKTAETYGYVPMQVRALEAVIQGKTSLEEAQLMVYIDSLALDLPAVSSILALAA